VENVTPVGFRNTNRPVFVLGRTSFLPHACNMIVLPDLYIQGYSK